MPQQFESWLRDSCPALESRAYQLGAWRQLQATRANGKDRALLHIATGLGKTSIAAVDVAWYQRQLGVKSRALFVSHVTDISRQGKATFERISPKMQTAYFKPSEPEVPDVAVLFTTFQSLTRNLNRFPADYFDYIIWDEAHHSEAHTFKRVRSYFQPRFQLALTATPRRRDNKDIFDYFGKPVFKKALADGIAEGWLAGVDYRIVFDEAVKNAIDMGFTPTSLNDIQRLFDNRPRNEVIVQNIKDERHKIGLDTAKTIVFCGTVDYAETMAGLLGGKAYHSGLDAKQRANILDEFRTGKLQVICTRDMFNEGVDIPDARLVVFLRSTESPTIFEQQLGRGLRRAPGKDTVTVLDFVANINRIIEVRKLGHNIDYAVRSQTGQFAGGGPVDMDAKDELGRLIIHNEYANFEFDKLAVDMLKMYDDLDVPLMPEDHITARQAALKLGVATDTLQSLCAKRGWDLPYYRQPATSGGAAWQTLSLKQLEELRTDPLVMRPVAGDDVLSMTEVCRELRTTHRTLSKVLVELDIPLTQYKFNCGNRRVVKGVPRESLPVLRGYLSIPPANVISISQAAKVLNYHHSALHKQVVRLAQQLGWSLKRYRFSSNALSYGVDPGQLEQLREFVENRRVAVPYQDILVAYKETGSALAAGKLVGLSDNAVRKRLRARGDYTNNYNWISKQEVL